MNQTDFMRLVGARDVQCMDVLVTKGKVYAVKDDRFSNFKSVGSMNGESPQEALWGMVSKHIIATRDMVKSGEVPTKKWITEYLGDIHNYMYLLEGVWEEQRCRED